MRELFLNACVMSAGPARLSRGRYGVSSDIATGIPEHAVSRRSRVMGGHARAFAVQLLGPFTMLAGVVWAVAQPYRIAFLDPDGKGLYDYLAQPPLLVFLVGAAFSLVIAPGLVDDLEGEEHGPAA
jgi:hypothetical protein